jgi:hypothetical protein
LGRTQIF